jgi:hypothetical protein
MPDGIYDQYQLFNPSKRPKGNPIIVNGIATYKLPSLVLYRTACPCGALYYHKLEILYVSVVDRSAPPPGRPGINLPFIKG